MTTLFIFVRVCICVLGFTNWRLLGNISSLEFLCYSLCFFGAIVELHAVDENLFDDFLIGE
jgi:hypothetical protein